MFSQNDFDAMPKFADFNYWFVANPDGTYNIFKKEDEVFIEDKQNIAETGTYITENEDINSAFELFKQRVEYIVGKKVAVPKDWDAETLQIDYEKLLIGCAFIKASKDFRFNPDDCWKKIHKCLEWLRSTDFFTCPASTQYHESFPSGLLYHTIQVVNRTVQLMKSEPFSSVEVAGAILVALVHDWCKIGLYEMYTRNVKNDRSGQWEQVAAYKYRPDRAICLGHGASSMYLAMKFFNLNMEEAAAIRHHMGRWNCVDSEVNELQQANRMYPLVHLVQFADQLAIVNY